MPNTVNEFVTTDPVLTHPMTASSAILDPNFKDNVKQSYKRHKLFESIIEDLKGSTPRPMNARFTLNSEGLLFYLDPSTAVERLCVPKNTMLRLKLLHDAHDAISAGHLGTSKTLSTISRSYFWPGMHKDVKEYVRSCDSCQQNKSSGEGPAGFLLSQCSDRLRYRRAL
jgi:hypothetical protein